MRDLVNELRQIFGEPIEIEGVGFAFNLGGRKMLEGTVARVMGDKRFGFIHSGDKDYFFHASEFNGHFDDLVDDFQQGRVVKVTFEPVSSEKGLRASEVTRVDRGV